MSLSICCKHTRVVPSPATSGALVEVNLELVRMLSVPASHRFQPRTTRAFITCAICTHEVTKQSLEPSFQTIFAGAIRIRHRGLEESCECCAASMFWVTDRFTESADVPDQGPSATDAQHSKTLTRSGVVRRQVSKQTPQRTVNNGEV